jgi:hypothetical protein
MCVRYLQQDRSAKLAHDDRANCEKMLLGIPSIIAELLFALEQVAGSKTDA